jgi:hypothetical protein
MNPNNKTFDTLKTRAKCRVIMENPTIIYLYGVVTVK